MSQRSNVSRSALMTLTPRFKRLLSVAYTNTIDFSNQDTQSVDAIDQTPAARASVAILDKLWSQIDVLDDVKAMAEEVDRTGGFFSEDFSDSLAQLKMSQSKLIDIVSRHQAQSDRVREQRHQQAKEHSEVVSVDEDGINNYQEQTRQRMSQFFAGSSRQLQETANLRDFDELNAYVLEVRDSLAEVSEKMTRFDDVTKKLW